MTIFVGIDISKDKFDVNVMATSGEELMKPREYKQAKEDIDKFISDIKSIAGKEEMRIGMEATGRYHMNLADYLIKKGLQITIFNPMETSSLRKWNIRKSKDDSIDACVVSNALCLDKMQSKVRHISEDDKPRRQSIALLFTPILKSKPAKVYVPEVYQEIIETIYSRIRYERKFISENKKSKYSEKGNGHIKVSVRQDHNQGIITVDKYGEGTLEQIHFHLKQLCLERIDCIYVDLPLNKKGTGYIASRLRELGFFFGYVIPEYSDSDVLRLQYLNNVEISKEDIKTASEFGQYLLDTIMGDRSEVST